MTKKKGVRQATNVKIQQVDVSGHPIPPTGTYTGRSGPVSRPAATSSSPSGRSATTSSAPNG